MVTWADAKRWQPGPLQGAVGPLNGAYNNVVAHSDDLRGLRAPDGWHGDAANAATGTANKVIDGLEEHAAELAALRRGMGDTGDAITGIQNGVKEAEGLAAAHNFRIGDDSGIIDNGPPPDTPEDQKAAIASERQTVAAELRDRVQQVITSATDLDNDFSVVLDKILSGHAIDAAATNNQTTTLASAGDAGWKQGALSIPQPPPDGATAAQNAAYWATLSHDQRTVLAMDHPELVGPRDGFSAEQRDISNRIILNRESNDLRNRRADILRHMDELRKAGGYTQEQEFQKLQAELGKIDDKLKGLADISKRLTESDPNWSTYDSKLERPYLLNVDIDGKGHAVVAMGNPDTAQNVATYVPGTGSELSNIGSDLTGADLMTESAKQAGSASTSVITWLGYDAPPAIQDAGSTSYADDGKHGLTSFQDGLRESHQGTPSHNTVLGHSYGTTLVGHAARDEHLAVNDIVLVASPGVGVDHASQLHIPPDHVYSSTAANDIINATNFPRDINGNSSGLDPLGPDPTDAEFGGKTFASDPGPGGPIFGKSIAAHSAYWDLTPTGEECASLQNMGRVIAGQPTQ